MFELAARLEARGRRLVDDAREWFERSARARSLDGRHAVVRFTVADREYEYAGELLRQLAAAFPDVPPRRYVSVAPDVLGRGVSLDGDDVDDVTGAGVFTVVTPYVPRAAAALDRVKSRLGQVDEFGRLAPPAEDLPEGIDPPYTPNFVFDVRSCDGAAVVALDTKGVMWSAMGRTMVGILVDALTADAIPAHIVGYRPDLEPHLLDWKPPAGAEPEP